MVGEWLSYEVEGYEDMKRRGLVNAHWDGKSTFFSYKTNSFPAGFCHSVIRKLKNRGFTVHWIRATLPQPLGPETPIVPGFTPDPKYSYQYETVRQLEKHGRIIAQVATGGGKSQICRLAYLRIKRPTLFLTTRQVLMYQMKEQVESLLSEEVGVLGDGDWSPVRGFNVAMVQTLAARLEVKTVEEEVRAFIAELNAKEEKALAELAETHMKNRVPMKIQAEERAALVAKLGKAAPTDRQIEKICTRRVWSHSRRRNETIELMKMFELVILEEAHEASGNSYYSILNACPNAFYRLALTATPFMRPSEEANMRLQACVGMIGIQVTEKELIEKGILAKPKFLFLPTAKPPGVFKTTRWPACYEKAIVDNEWRNAVIVAHCVKAIGYGLSSMVLVQRKKHGKTLETMLTKAGVRCKFIYGADNQEARKKALADLASGVIDVLIGTNILDVGVDVPSVGTIVQAGGGKAEVATRQRIGRGLRAKKSGPNAAFILDFRDEHNKTTQEHAMTRMAIVMNTPGFMENVLPDTVREFDFAAYGFTKKKGVA